MTPIVLAFTLLSATLLEQTDNIIRLYSQEVAKAPPPSPEPQTTAALKQCSTWLMIDPASVGSLSSPDLWRLIRDMGFQGVLCKQESINPAANWDDVLKQALAFDMYLGGGQITNSIQASTDLMCALQGVGNYPSLFSMVEIDPDDWSLLPTVGPLATFANVPWLQLQMLYDKGYVPNHFSPYVKESQWNASPAVTGEDGKARRWIYLREGVNRPVLAWLSPSFLAYRLAAGIALEGAYQRGLSMLCIDSKLPFEASEMLSLWIRKLGNTSLLLTQGTLQEALRAPSDLVSDEMTRPALLHALIAEDAEALRIMYRLFLEEQLDTKRLVHVLQPFDAFAVDWKDWACNPTQRLTYYEEQMTADVLRKRLMREDVLRLMGSTEVNIPPLTWPGYCALTMQGNKFQDQKEWIQQAHLMLASCYALQPGGFVISTSDLMGVLPDQRADVYREGLKNWEMGKEAASDFRSGVSSRALEHGVNEDEKSGAKSTPPTTNLSVTSGIDLMNPGPNTLYSSLPTQLASSRSFASGLKAVFAARQKTEIATGELVGVLPSANRGTLLLMYRLPKNRYPYVLAVNFGRSRAREMVEAKNLINTTAVDVVSGTALKKAFGSPQVMLDLAPLSVQAIYFQPMHYAQ
ncbi:MAG: trehalose synthase [Chlamydiota bacterium]|jgi:hypothetical protein